MQVFQKSLSMAENGKSYRFQILMVSVVLVLNCGIPVYCFICARLIVELYVDCILIIAFLFF